MPFDVASALAQRRGDAVDLHERYLNRQLARVLRTIGFDGQYVRGEGSYLYDQDGQRYLDFLAGFGVYALGRSHPGVKAALHQAIDLDLPNMVQLDCALLPGLLAEQLVSRSHPGIERVFFCNSGAEAVEAAIKFARQATGRSRVLYAEHAFHGLTNGALSLNGGQEFRRGFGPLLPGFDAVPFGDVDALRREVRSGDVAAFVVEPIQGKSLDSADTGYWSAVQEVCHQHGTLLVMDEVQTGLGRTGRFFAHEHWDLRPDIITVSKALSGGYVPVGAMLTSDRIFSTVYRSMADAVKHSSTFGRNQLAMVAGLATLTAFDEEDVIARAERSGRALRAALASLAERYDVIGAIRGEGLMIGIEFTEPAAGPLRRVFRTAERLRHGLFAQMIVVPLYGRHRILTQVAADNVNIVKLLPPLVVGQAEISYFAEALDDVLADAYRGGGLVTEFGRTMARGALGRRSGHRARATGHDRAPAAHGTIRNGHGAPVGEQEPVPTGQDAAARPLGSG